MLPSQPSTLIKSAVAAYACWWMLCGVVTLAVMFGRPPLADAAGGPGRDWTWGGDGAAPMRVSGSPPLQWRISFYRMFGVTEVHADAVKAPPISTAQEPLRPVDSAMTTPALAAARKRSLAATSWSIAHEAVPVGMTENSVVVDRAYGWPSRVWAGSVTFRAAPAIGGATAAAASYTLVPTLKSGRWLDSGLWAIAGWGLLAAPLGVATHLTFAQVRARRRLARGLCPECGYGLGSSQRISRCSECGWSATSFSA